MEIEYVTLNECETLEPYWFGKHKPSITYDACIVTAYCGVNNIYELKRIAEILPDNRKTTVMLNGEIYLICKYCDGSYAVSKYINL